MSNKDLRAKAIDLAKTLKKDLPPDFSGMNTDALEVLVSQYEADVKALPLAPPPPPPPPPGPAPVVASSGKRYFVPRGKSITCKRGVLATELTDTEETEIFPADLGGLDNDKPNPAELLERQNKQLDYLAGRGHLNAR
jgi:hypothetical protein